MLNVNKEKKVLINSKKINLKKLNIEHLLDIRSSLGHRLKYVNFFSESFILGNINNISIFHIEHIWKSFKIFYEILVHSFFRRNSFFLVITNHNIPSQELAKEFEKNFFRNKKDLYKSLYFTGYIHKDWYGGLLANWTRTSLLLKLYIRMYRSNKSLSKHQIQVIKKLKGVWTRQLHPTFPDFVISLDNNYKALHELNSIKMPVAGLSDVNCNPFNLSLFVLGNDDSYDNVSFFLKLLEETSYEGRAQEKELFFHLIFFELHKILENEII